MKRKIAIWLICFVALIAWTGLVYGQTAKPTAVKLLKLPNGQEVFDISGEWDVLVENHGEFAIFGTYTNVANMTIRESDSSFHAVRMNANPPPSNRAAGSLIVIGNLDKNGITKLDVIGGSAGSVPGTWQISENGNKINVDAPNRSKITFTRK
jgi:hypothetical protein